MNKKEITKIIETAAKLIKSDERAQELNSEAMDFLVRAFERNSELTYRHADFILNSIQKRYNIGIYRMYNPLAKEDFYVKFSHALFQEMNIKSCLEISGHEGEFIESFVGKFPKVALTAMIDKHPLWQAAARNGLVHSDSAIISSLEELNPSQKFDVIWSLYHTYDRIHDTLEAINAFSPHLSDNGILLLRLYNQPSPSFIHECNRKSGLKLAGMIEVHDPSDERPSYVLIFSKYFHTDIFVAQLDSELSMRPIVGNFLNKNSESLKRGKMISARSYVSFEQIKAEEELAALGKKLGFTKVKFGDLLNRNLLKEPVQDHAVYLTKKRELFEKVGIDLNKAKGDIKQLDLSKYNIYMGDFYLPGIKTRYFEPLYLEDENFLKTPLVDFSEKFKYELGELDIQETFKHQIIKIPLDSAKINRTYFVSLLSRPIGKLFLQILYSFIEQDNGKLDIKKISDIDLYIEPIEIQNKKGRLMEQLDGSIKQLQLITENLEEEKFQEKLEKVITSLQKEFASKKIDKESLNLLVEDYFGNEKIYDSIRRFDRESHHRMLEKYPKDDRIQNIGTVMDFLRTGEWVWQRYKDILIYQNPHHIDLTFLVACHFKAVEIYVCKKLASLCEGDCLVYDKKTKKFGKPIGTIEYYTDSTLGEYLHYIKNNRNKNLFNDKVNFAEKENLIASFEKWKDECRNAYQHKDILPAIETVKSIRNRTRTLFILFENRLRD